MEYEASPCGVSIGLRRLRLLNQLYNSISNWIPLLSLIMVPSLIAAAMWRLWSKSTEFKLTDKEKLLRIAIVVELQFSRLYS